MAKFGPDREGSSYQLLFPKDAVGFDPEAFDDLLRNQGVQMVHWRAMKCPVGMTDPDDIRRPHDHHENCSNGFLYTKVGVVTVGFLGNSSDYRFIDAGRLDGSTVNIVLPRFYDDQPDLPVEVSSFDRMYLSEETITVVTWHTFAHHRTGIDRLLFPAVKVNDLVDSKGIRYHEGSDFQLKGGQIHWGNRRPGTDADTGKGVVCSVHFSYRPFWYVKNLVHEVRVAQTEDEFGDRKVQRMPQSCVLQREYFFEKEQADSQTPSSDRKKPGPGDGGFGPR